MKNIYKLIVLMVMLLPINIYAASINVNCPSKAYAGANVNCTIVLSSDGTVNGVQGKISSTLEAVSASNASGTMGYIDTTGFALGNVNNFATTANIGTLSYKVPSNATVGTKYTVSISSIVGSSSAGKININNTTTSIEVMAPSTTTTKAPTKAPTTAAPTTTTGVQSNNQSTTQKSASKGTTAKTTTKSNKTTSKTTTIQNQKSNDNTLASLKVNGKTIDLSGGLETFKVTVDSAALDLDYRTNNDKASVTVNGNTTLELGENNITLVVTAEDGTTKNYTIQVVREEKELEEVNLDLKTLTIKGYKINFDKNKSYYDLKIKNEKKLEIEAIPFDNKNIVKITGNENLKNNSKIIITFEFP